VWLIADTTICTNVYVLVLVIFVGEWKFMGSGFIVRELVGSATPIYGILHIATV